MNISKKYIAVLKMGLSDAFEYRFNFLMAVLLWYFPLIIDVLLWTLVYHSSGNKMIGGYTLNRMISYYIVTMIVSSMTSTENIEWSVISDIKDGALQRHLIQPLNYQIFKLAYVLSKKVVVLVCILINMIPLLLLFRGYMEIQLYPVNFLLFFLSLLLSLVIFFHIQVSIAMLSFWFTQFSSIFHFLPFIYAVLSGVAFPLNILPGWISNALSFTPFYYVVFFPVQILTDGNITSDIIVKGFCIQSVWALLCVLLCKFVWVKGIQRFSATGG